jgi:large conductance mechanosensitive channel
MLKDFKAFILRGSVVDLAVGIVIGMAFTLVVTSFVKDLLTPLVSIPGKANFSNLHFTVNGSQFQYGAFVNALISFVLVSAAVFFVVVRPVNSLLARRRAGEETEPGTRDCPQCLSEIPAAAHRCSFCTSEVEPTAPATT